MIKPHKHMDLDLCVIRISSVIIRILKKNKIMGYEELLYILTQEFSEDIRGIYVAALNFLYLIMNFYQT